MSGSGERRHEVRKGAAERRQLYARDTRLPADASLVYLGEGQAEALRPACRAGVLICPVPGCEDPRYTTRAGSRRDHFAHLRLLDETCHARERVQHYFGKHAVGAWVRERYPEARVVVDEEAVDNGQRPDVLATFPDGRRFAFEVQYAGINPDAWRRRHEGYRAQGISDVWLFGHIPPHLRKAREDDAVQRFVLTAILEAVEDAGCAVRWINPDEQVIYTRLVETESEHVWSPSGARQYIEVGGDPLESCWIEGTAFRTPTDDREAHARARRLEREAAERARQEQLLAERLGREARQREWAQKRQAERDAWLARKAAEKQQRWSRYREKAAWLGNVPVIIERELPTDRRMWHYLPAHWHALIFERHIQRRIGQAFSYARIVAPLLQMQPQARVAVYQSLNGYLFHLRDAGYLAFDSWGDRITSEIRVLADLEHPPPPLEDAPRPEPRGVQVLGRPDQTPSPSTHGMDDEVSRSGLWERLDQKWQAERLRIVKKHWPTLVAWLASQAPWLGPALRAAHPVEVNERTLVVAFPSAADCDLVTADAARQVVEAACGRILGFPYHLQCTVRAHGGDATVEEQA